MANNGKKTSSKQIEEPTITDVQEVAVDSEEKKPVRKRKITKITYIHTLNTLPSAKSICMLIYSTIAMALKLFSDFRESFFNKLFQFSASSD